METNDEVSVGRWVDDHLATLTPAADWTPDPATGFSRLDRERRVRRGRRQRWAWGLASTAVLSICVLIFPATSIVAQRCLNACVADTSFAVNILWQGLSGSDQTFAGITKISERRTAPDFMLPDNSGTRVRLSDYRGQVVLLNFWATWCAPCKVEIPWFMEFQRTYRDSGFAVLGISLDEDGWKSVTPYVDEEKIDYRVMVSDDKFAQQYIGVESLPTTLIIDRAGRIAVVHAGLVEKRTYQKELKALLAEDNSEGPRNEKS